MTNNNHDPRTRRALVMSGAAMTGVLALAGCDLGPSHYTDEQKEQIADQVEPEVAKIAQIAIDGTSVVRLEKESRKGKIVTVTIGSAPAPAPRYEAKVKFDMTEADTLDVDNVDSVYLSNWVVDVNNPDKMTIHESIFIDKDGDGNNNDRYWSVMALNDMNPRNKKDDVFIANLPRTPRGENEPDMEAALSTTQDILDIINDDYLPQIAEVELQAAP